MIKARGIHIRRYNKNDPMNILTKTLPIKTLKPLGRFVKKKTEENKVSIKAAAMTIFNKLENRFSVTPNL
jgi:hypothetical protein